MELFGGNTFFYFKRWGQAFLKCSSCLNPWWTMMKPTSNESIFSASTTVSSPNMAKIQRSSLDHPNVSLVSHLKVRQHLNLRLPLLAGDALFLFIIILFDRKNSKSEVFGIFWTFLDVNTDTQPCNFEALSTQKYHVKFKI